MSSSTPSVLPAQIKGLLSSKQKASDSELRFKGMNSSKSHVFGCLLPSSIKFNLQKFLGGLKFEKILFPFNVSSGSNSNLYFVVSLPVSITAPVSSLLI